AICQREAGQPEESLRTLKHLLSNHVRLDNDMLLEAYLIAFKTCLALNQANAGAAYLRQALMKLDVHLDTIERLHYRRGFRERFVPRFKTLIPELPSNGAVDSILPLLSLIKSSMMGDWLSYLDWIESVMDSPDIDSVKKRELKSAVDVVMKAGAPVLYGYREKYDDPFESLGPPGGMVGSRANRDTLANPWHNLNLITQELMNGSEIRPYSRSSLFSVEMHLRDQLTLGNYLLLQFNIGKKVYFVALWKESYRIVTTDNEPFVAFLVALRNYAAQVDSRDVLVKSLESTAARLREILAPIVTEIATTAPPNVIIMLDALGEMCPIHMSLFEDQRIRDLVMANRLVVRHCPIAYPGQLGDNRGNFLGLFDSRQELSLPGEEINMVLRQLEPQEQLIADLSNEGEQKWQDWDNFDIVHLASHGHSIAIFTDPWFASLTSGVQLAKCQRHLSKYQTSLFFLNACHGSSVTNRNYFNVYRTDENLGFATLCLLNRRACVIAPTWGTFDVVAYVFAHIFYSTLMSGAAIPFAYSRSVARLAQLTKEEITEILQQVQAPIERSRLLSKFAQTNQDRPLANSYVTGAYVLTSLFPVSQVDS
ncbi:MAG: hypothetical protein ACP5IL_16575, partial [Syntrophobacteraceae bacterium]